MCRQHKRAKDDNSLFPVGDEDKALNSLNLAALSLGPDEIDGYTGADSPVLRASKLAGNSNVMVERPVQLVSDTHDIKVSNSLSVYCCDRLGLAPTSLVRRVLSNRCGGSEYRVPTRKGGGDWGLAVTPTNRSRSGTKYLLRCTESVAGDVAASMERSGKRFYKHTPGKNPAPNDNGCYRVQGSSSTSLISAIPTQSGTSTFGPEKKTRSSIEATTTMLRVSIIPTPGMDKE